MQFNCHDRTVNYNASMRELALLDSITQISPQLAGAIIVTGSHGGRSSAGFSLQITPLPYAVFFNDAGVGKDQAGIFCLEFLQAQGVLGVTYGHDTARIGEAQDALDHGVITHLNNLAQAAGLRATMSVAAACKRLR